MHRVKDTEAQGKSQRLSVCTEWSEVGGGVKDGEYKSKDKQALRADEMQIV